MGIAMGFDSQSLQPHIQKIASVLKILGNETRLKIFCLLCEQELNVNDINQHLSISQSALSQHLALMRKEGIVVTRRAAQTIFYSAPEGPAVALIRSLKTIYVSNDNVSGEQI